MKHFEINNTGVVPLSILSPGEDIPDEWLSEEPSFRFFLQGDQLFKLSRNNIYTSITKVSDQDKLLKQMYKKADIENFNPENITLLENRAINYSFPRDEFVEVMRYFREIYETYKTEAAVLLMAHTEKEEWKVLYVVQASGSGAEVVYAQPILEYENLEGQSKRVIESIMEDDDAKALHLEVVENYRELLNEGWEIFGTIHSHCDFSAFHSGTDDADEVDFPGLHITIGNVLSGWSYSARFSIDGAYFPIEVSDILDCDDMTEIERLVDDVDFDEDMLDLMMPSLLRPAFTLVRTSSYKPTPRNNLWDWNGWNPDDTIDIEELQEASDDYFEEFNENVWEQSEAFRLRNSDTGEIIIVNKSYYHKYKEFFSEFDNIGFGSSPVTNKKPKLPQGSKDDLVMTVLGRAEMLQGMVGEKVKQVTRLRRKAKRK